MCDQIVDFYYEFRLGVTTQVSVKLADVGIQDADAKDSQPISYAAFYSMIRRLRIEKAHTTFVDYGAGKGRAVCAAAALPFKRVIGIDISKQLAEEAVGNLRRMRLRRVRQFEVVHIDANDYRLPDEANLLYLYNPFCGDTLSRVFDNITASYQRRPRKIHILFFNNGHFDKIAHRYPWIFKTHQTVFHPHVSCGLYESLEVNQDELPSLDRQSPVGPDITEQPRESAGRLGQTVESPTSKCHTAPMTQSADD